MHWPFAVLPVSWPLELPEKSRWLIYLLSSASKIKRYPCKHVPSVITHLLYPAAVDKPAQRYIIAIFRLTNNKAIVISKPLFDYDRLLSDTIFLRIHKSFLINLLHVKEYVRGEGGSVLMTNGMEIEVSRRKKEQFLIKIKERFKY